MKHWVVGDEQGRAHDAITGKPLLIHGHSTWVPNHERWRRLYARVTRMIWETETLPERIVLSVDVCGQELDLDLGDTPIRVAPTRCDPALPPNSIVFEGAGLPDAESPRPDRP